MYMFKFATLVLLVSLRFAETKPVSYKDYNSFPRVIQTHDDVPENLQSSNILHNKGFPIADNAGIQSPYLLDPTLTDIKSKHYPNDGIPSSLQDAKKQMVEPVQTNNVYPNSMNEPNLSSYRGHWNGQVPLSQSNKNEISNSDKRNETVQGSIDNHPGSNPSFNGVNSDTLKEITQLSFELSDGNLKYVEKVNDQEVDKNINPYPDEDQIINGNIDSNVSEEHAYGHPAVNPNSVFSNAQMYIKNVSEENTLDAQNPQFEEMHQVVQALPEKGLHDSPYPYQDQASLSQIGKDSENISEKSEDDPQYLSKVQLSSEQGYNNSQEFSDRGENITLGVTEHEIDLQESYPGSKESFEELLHDKQNSSERQVYIEQGYEDNQALRKEGVDDSEGFSNNGSNNEINGFEILPNGTFLIHSQPSLEEKSTYTSYNTDTLQFEESDVRYEEVNSFPTGDESEVIDSVSHFEDVINENTSHSLLFENTMASNNQNFTPYPEYTNSLSDQLESSLATDTTNKNSNTMKDTLNDDVDQYRHGNDGTDFVKVESAVATDEVVETISKSEEKQIRNGDEVSNSLFGNDEVYEYNGNYSENNGINENELNESNLENYPFDDTNENLFLSSMVEDELSNESVELDMSETASDDIALLNNEDYGEKNYNEKNTLEKVDKGFTWEDNDVNKDMFEKEDTQGYDIDESTDDDRNEEIAYQDDLYSVDGDNIDSRLTGQDDIEHFGDEEMDTSLLDKDLAKLDVQNDSFSFITVFVIFTFLIVFAMLYYGGLRKFKHLMFVALHKGKGSRLSWKRDGYSLVSHRGEGLYSSKSA